MLRVTLAMLVMKLGGESQIADDGPTGLEAVTEFRPHVVLLDIGMPGMDGYERAAVSARRLALRRFL